MTGSQVLIASSSNSRWSSTIAESFKKEIEIALRQLREGGVICPNFDDRFQAVDPSESTWILTEWKVVSLRGLWV